MLLPVLLLPSLPSFLPNIITLLFLLLNGHNCLKTLSALHRPWKSSNQEGYDKISGGFCLAIQELAVMYSFASTTDRNDKRDKANQIKTLPRRGEAKSWRSLSLSLVLCPAINTTIFHFCPGPSLQQLIQAPTFSGLQSCVTR